MAIATEKPAAEMTARLRGDLKQAMLDRDAERTALLRALIAAIDNAGAVSTEGSTPRSLQAGFGTPGVEAVRHEPDAAELAALLSTEEESRLQAAASYRAAAREDLAERLDREVTAIAAYRAGLRTQT